MPDVAVARPLPTVLQPADIRPRHSRVVSFSSSSKSTPSSNPHSGESWFQIHTSQASHSSASSLPPLPRGARPASPQPARAFELDTHAHLASSRHTRAPLKRSGTFSSWKLEWRGISKVVKWAVGDKLRDEHRSSRRNSTTSKNQLVGSYSKGYQRSPSQHFEPESGFSPYVPAAISSPVLSPTTSATCVDVLYEGGYSVSELDGHEKRIPMSDSEVHLPSRGLPSFPDESGSKGKIRMARRVSHVRNAKDTTAPCTVSELGHGHPCEATYNMQDTFHGIDCSTTSLNTHDGPHSRGVAQSDVGHSRRLEPMPLPPFPSTLSLSNGHDYANVRARTRSGPFKNFRSMQSAIAIPVSSAHSTASLNHHRRPRKLRKSLRAMPRPEGRDSQAGLCYSASVSERRMLDAETWKTASVVLSAPPTPPKPRPRPPRKLKKRPSPALPPLPRTSSCDASGDPPPVPPKSASMLEKQHVTEIKHAPGYRSPGDSSVSPSTSADSSGSTSVEEELESAQETPATSENHDEEGPVKLQVKRPSLLRTESNRRWTVAVADAPDDLFIEELERLRRMGLRAGDVHGLHNVTQKGHVAVGSREQRGISDDRVLGAKEVERTKTTNAVLIQQMDTDDEMEWLHARRAILCCRELVRTERSYQERLQELADGNVSDAVPALLLRYLPALIGASKILSARFNEDMSASGVSKAFLNVSTTLERALVAWSGVVGEFFEGNRDPANTTKRKRDTAVPGFIAEEEMDTEFGAVKVRCMSMHGREQVYMARSSSGRWFGAEGMSTGGSSHWLFRPAFAQGANDTSHEKDDRFELRKSLRRPDVKEKERRRKPPFRDLAILPTQRVTRYILLYKDLLKNTPHSSPTRGIVQRAVDAAIRLARKCDRAQDNSAFIFHG